MSEGDGVDVLQVLAGVGLSLGGHAMIGLYTVSNRKARGRGRLAHWFGGWLLAVPGMTAIAVGWGLLCTTGATVSFPGAFPLGIAFSVLGALVYVISACRVGRWQRPSTYSVDLFTGGIYRWVRHPQALALCLVSVGLGLTTGSAPYLCSVPLWVAGWVAYTYIEERLELIPTFGDDYLAYRKRTARLLPGLF